MIIEHSGWKMDKGFFCEKYSARLMSTEDENGDYTEWVEF